MLTDEGFCSSSKRLCTRRKLDGYQFCFRHILEDKNSPYRQCSRVSAATGRRCTNAAPLSSRKEGLCTEHLSQVSKGCVSDSSRRCNQTAANLLEQLDHYRITGSNSAHSLQHSPSSSSSGGGGGSSSTSGWQGSSTSSDIFVGSRGGSGGGEGAAEAAPAGVATTAAATAVAESDGGCKGGFATLSTSAAVPAKIPKQNGGPIATSAADPPVGWTSSDDSCSEELPAELGWRVEPNSDDDSVDSEGDDPFKYTDVFTEEEAVRITREKLVRLQSLYVEQFKCLQQILTEDRRRYVSSQAKCESQQLLGASSSPLHASSTNATTSVSTMTDGSRPHMPSHGAAIMRYRKRSGVETLLHRRSKEQQLAGYGSGSSHECLPPAMQRCNAGTGRTGRCNSRVVPLSKFCLRHISSDPHQVLFKRCSFLDGRCDRLVPAVFTSTPRCDLHEGFSSNRAAAIIRRVQRPTAATLTATATTTGVSKQHQQVIVTPEVTQQLPTSHALEPLLTPTNGVADGSAGLTDVVLAALDSTAAASVDVAEESHARKAAVITGLDDAVHAADSGLVPSGSMHCSSPSPEVVATSNGMEVEVDVARRDESGPNA